MTWAEEQYVVRVSVRSQRERYDLDTLVDTMMEEMRNACDEVAKHHIDGDLQVSVL